MGYQGAKPPLILDGADRTSPPLPKTASGSIFSVEHPVRAYNKTSTINDAHTVFRIEQHERNDMVIARTLHG